MAKGSTYASQWLKLIFQNLGISNIGDATGIPPTGTAGSIFYSLHTADPTASGNQTSSEISYTPYVREGVARSTGGHTVTGNSVSPASTISFPQMTSGSGGTATFFMAGRDSSGTGESLYSGSISPTIPVANGVTAQLTSSTAITES